MDPREKHPTEVPVGLGGCNPFWPCGCLDPSPHIPQHMMQWKLWLKPADHPGWFLAILWLFSMGGC